jgi:hypothetical protein
MKFLRSKSKILGGIFNMRREDWLQHGLQDRGFVLWSTGTWEVGKHGLTVRVTFDLKKT